MPASRPIAANTFHRFLDLRGELHVKIYEHALDNEPRNWISDPYVFDYDTKELSISMNNKCPALSAGSQTSRADTQRILDGNSKQLNVCVIKKE